MRLLSNLHVKGKPAVLPDRAIRRQSHYFIYRPRINMILGDNIPLSNNECLFLLSGEHNIDCIYFVCLIVLHVSVAQISHHRVGHRYEIE